MIDLSHRAIDWRLLLKTLQACSVTSASHIDDFLSWLCAIPFAFMGVCAVSLWGE